MKQLKIQIQTMHLIIRLFSSHLQAQNVLFLQQYEIKLQKKKKVQQNKYTLNLRFWPNETFLGCNADMFRMRCGPEWTSIYEHILVGNTIAGHSSLMHLLPLSFIIINIITLCSSLPGLLMGVLCRGSETKNVFWVSLRHPYCDSFLLNLNLWFCLFVLCSPWCVETQQSKSATSGQGCGKSWFYSSSPSPYWLFLNQKIPHRLFNSQCYFISQIH